MQLLLLDQTGFYGMNTLHLFPLLSYLHKQSGRVVCRISNLSNPLSGACLWYSLEYLPASRGNPIDSTIARTIRKLVRNTVEGAKFTNRSNLSAVFDFICAIDIRSSIMVCLPLWYSYASAAMNNPAMTARNFRTFGYVLFVLVLYILSFS